MGKARYKTDKELPNRDPNDFYPTDPELVRAALLKYGPTLAPTHILDIGAGTGVWGEVAKDLWPCAKITGVELQAKPCHPAYDYWFDQVDFRNFEPPTGHWYDLIIGNPPFDGVNYRPPLWEQLFFHAWSMLRPIKRNHPASIIWLLPLDITTGIKRYKRLWLKYPMFTHAPCIPRPSHNGDGSRKTAFREEGIALWHKNWDGGIIGCPGEWHTAPLVWRDDGD